jgi:anhydro-N-acetylmuramic acid kinase
MARNSTLVLGLMSGTSADGVEVALARIAGAPPKLQSHLVNHASFPLPSAVRKEILRIAEGAPTTAGEISKLNFRLGQVFADAALLACKGFRIPPSKINLIASHGQTIFHQGQPWPFLGESTAATFQIAEAAVIAARTGITTVADFRPSDVATGGQGAPLVPYADYLLYRHPRVGRVSLNLGGIANVTVIPAGAKPSDVLAFDTGPANMLIDALVSHFSKGRKRFDENARLAEQGQTNVKVLEKLLQDPFLKLSPPKSTGREYYGMAYLQRMLSLGRKFRAKPNDLIRTATIFSALSVVDSLHRFVLAKTKIDELIVSGGGTDNPLFMGQLSAALKDIEILPSSKFGIPENAKEAYAFALLGYETIHRRPSNLISATGAREPAILGKISYAPPR